MTRENLIYAFSLVCPWLAATWAVSLVLWRRPDANAARFPWAKILRRMWLPMATLGLVLVPFCGVPLGRWVAGCNANFSIPLTVWLGLSLCERWLGRRTLSAAEKSACWGFGLVAGLFLYPMALGLTAFDPYSLGWQPGWLLSAALVVIVVLLAVGNRFALWIMLALLAYNLRLLESPNLWDYLVDPFYCIGSAIVGIAAGLSRLQARSGEAASSGKVAVAAGQMDGTSS